MVALGTSRVHILVRNPGHIDTRVRKTAVALKEQGCAVTVFATQHPDVPDREVLDGIQFERVAQAVLSRDHRSFAYRLRRRTRDRKLARAVAAATTRKQAALGYYSARRTKALGGPANLRRLSFARWRVAVSVAIAMVSLHFAKRMLRLRLFRMRSLRGLAHATHSIKSRVVERRWAQSERRHAWRAEWWYYNGFARSILEVAGERPAEIVHANDLNTLWAGWRLARRLGAKLIYDSHELELDRNTKWTPAKREMAGRVERFCIARAAGVITVSDPIADLLQERYLLRTRPSVVLNSPPLNSRDLTVPDYETVRGIAGIRPQDRLLTYIGKVAPGRGVDQILEALLLLPVDVHLSLLGPREDRYDEPLTIRAFELGLANRLHMMPSVPSALVPAVLRGVDVTVNASQNVCLSYDLALPNKLFDTVMAGIPTVVGGLRAMSGFVVDHSIGLACDELDPADISKVVCAALTQHHAGLEPDALDALQHDVAWEHQSARLVGLYESI
jgi:glycosyltransferase involved in cell wall biosynthesis